MNWPDEHDVTVQPGPVAEHLGLGVRSRTWEVCEDGVYENRVACTALIECPRCGENVECIAETDCWTEKKPRRWHHSGYGPGLAECCGLLLVDGYEAAEAYELPVTKRASGEPKETAE